MKLTVFLNPIYLILGKATAAAIIILTVIAICGCKKNGNYETYKWDNTPVLSTERIANLDFLHSNFGIGLAFNRKKCSQVVNYPGASKL